MSVTLLQSSTEETGSGSATVSLTGVTAGSTIVVVVFQTATGTRTYSATDYTSAIASTGSARQAAILYRESVASGSHSITVNANIGTTGLIARAFEFSACAFSASDIIIEGGNNTDHHCAQVGSLDVSGDALIVSGGVLNANGGTLDVTTGATRINSGANNYLIQYETSGSGFTDERSTWTSSTTRTAINVSAGFAAVASGTTVNLDLSNSTEIALSILVFNPRSYLLQTASEIGNSQQVNVINPRTYQLAFASELGQVDSLTIENPKFYQLGTVNETSVAFGLTIGSDQVVGLGVTSEACTANILSVTNPRTYQLSNAAETNEAVSLTIGNNQNIALSFAQSAGFVPSLIVMNPRTYAMTPASETNTANPIAVIIAGQQSLISQYYLHLAS